MTTELAVPQAFMATTPAMMQTAQKHMVEWCNVRLEREKIEITDLELTISAAQYAGLKVGAWRRRLAMSRAKMVFYRKTRAALVEGYYIVPPFPVQTFAIRTTMYGD